MIKSRPASEVAQLARLGATLEIDGSAYSAPDLKYIADVAAGASGSVTLLNMGAHNAPEIGSIAAAGPKMELDAKRLTAGQLASIASYSAQGAGSLVIFNSEHLTTSQMVGIYERSPRKIAFR